MGDRLGLHSKLEATFTPLPIYYQPPTNTIMTYPCVVYEKSDRYENFADNNLYTFKIKYLVTIIDKDPDSSLLDKLSDYKLTSYDRRFISDGLYHDVFTMFY